MIRTTGWIQDACNLDSLISLVEIFNFTTNTHKNLLSKKIPDLVQERDGKSKFINALNSRNGFSGQPQINYIYLVGTSFKPRSSARCNGIIQALIPGEKRQFISDWPANNYLRWAESLNLIQCNLENDTYTITQDGLSFSNLPEVKKFGFIKNLLLQYTPVIRILQCLYNQYFNDDSKSLTKYELGAELGFKGEDGFTNYPLSFVIAEMEHSPKEKSKILRNWEGSSDKYARTICSWLSDKRINWIQDDSKIFSRISIPSYKITNLGIQAFRKSHATSRHPKIPKIVHFGMLATKRTDSSYLRLRRAKLLEYLTKWYDLESLQKKLQNDNFNNISLKVIEDDIQNFERIGLKINYLNSNSKYKLEDIVISLNIPISIKREIIKPSTITKIREELSSKIYYISHKFLDIVDLGYSSKKNRLYETRIVELLKEIFFDRAKHLPGSNRPEIVCSHPTPNPEYGIIFDSKAYKDGFTIPASERDKMIRYINDFEQKDVTLNKTKWWEFFFDVKYPKNPIIYGFISSYFKGKYLDQINHIYQRTKKRGCVINSEALIQKVDDVKNPNKNYTVIDFINELQSNNLIT